MPALHAKHAVESVDPKLTDVMYVPGTQPVQLAKPDEAAYLPGAQARQPALPVLPWYAPALHAVHTTVPPESVLVPAGHGEQLVDAARPVAAE